MPEAALATETTRLAEFARVFKAAARSVTLYPDGHPSIEATLGRLMQLTNPPLLTAPLRIGVTPENLLLDGQPVGKPDTVIGDLAGVFHRQKIGELRVLPGGSVASWRQFLLLVERSPEELRAEGGIGAAWAALGHTHLEIREIDYAEALRERYAGTAVTWERVVGNCLQGDALEIPEELIDAVLDEDTHEDAVARALESVTLADGEGATVTARTDTLIKLIGGIVRSMAGRPRERVEPVMRDLSTAMGRLSPELLVSVIQRLKQAASQTDPTSATIVEGLMDGMSDTTISTFVATNAAGFAAPVERVVQAFQSLVWDDSRKERLVSLAHEQARIAEGHDPEFEGRWRDVAQKLLKSYDDRSYVAESYAYELNHARTQAVQIEQLKEDPPEQIEAWMSTVTTSELRKLDLTLVVDLLTIERTPEQRASLVEPVLALIRDLLLVGDFDAVETLLTALVGTREHDTPSALERAVLERVPTAATVEHLVGHLASIEHIYVEQVKRVCHQLGAYLVQPLVEALALEDRTRIRERLTETILGFQGEARPRIEPLRESSDPAIRRTALYLLRELGVTDDLPELQDLIRDDDARSQMTALQTIIRVATPRGYRLFIQAFNAASPSSRDALMRSVVTSRDERAAPLLLQVLEQIDYTGELGWAYERAIEQLGVLRHAPAVPALLAVLQRGEWWAPRRTATLRSAAATALARIATPEALAALDQASRSGSRGVRKVAASQLQTAGSARPGKDAR